MLITCISDTHHRHNKVIIPKCDVLVHAGDLTNKGSLNDVRDFARWLRKQPATHKIVVAGNHDFCFQNDSKAARKALGDSCIYLQDEEIIIDNIKFYGMPWSVSFGNWAFGLPRGSKEMYDVCKKIPDNTNVLITHGPPNKILDQTYFGDYAGCQTLIKKIYNLEHLKAHIFGHIHEGYSVENNHGIQFVNASTCTLAYQPTNRPIIIEVQKH